MGNTLVLFKTCPVERVIKREEKVTQSCLTLQLYSPWNSPGQNTGVGSLSLLQRIFLTQELNQSFLHCRRILHQLSYQGSLRVIKQVPVRRALGPDNVKDEFCKLLRNRSF